MDRILLALICIVLSFCFGANKKEAEKLEARIEALESAREHEDSLKVTYLQHMNETLYEAKRIELELKSQKEQ